MNRIASACVMTVGTTILSGCALFTNWSRNADVVVDAAQKDVGVTVFRDGEPYAKFNTPNVVTLKASECFFFPSEYVFRFEKKGYCTQEEMRSGHICYGYWGNVWNIIGFAIDPLCDHLYSIEKDPIHVDLKRETSRR